MDGDNRHDYTRRGYTAGSRCVRPDHGRIRRADFISDKHSAQTPIYHCHFTAEYSFVRSADLFHQWAPNPSGLITGSWILCRKHLVGNPIQHHFIDHEFRLLQDK